ncbi:hypothetical protein ACHAWF_016954 [Thalassiosira exigua]
MSQEGTTLIYPPSVAAPASAPFHQAMNTAGPRAGPAAVVADHHSSDDEKHAGGEGGASKGKGGGVGGKSRRELPAGAVATLKAWLLSPEHFTHPYPTPQDQIMLMHKTGIDKKQLKNWFTNARRRIWKPMLKKQLEAGKLAAAAGGVAMTLPGGTNLTVNSQLAAQGGGLAVAVPSAQGVPQPELSPTHRQPHQPPPQQEMFANSQQAQSQPGQYQQQQQQQQYQQQVDPNQPQYQQQVQYDQSGQMQQQPMYDQYGNSIYQDQSYQQFPQPPVPGQQTQSQAPPVPAPSSINANPNNNYSIGSLAPLNLTGSMASFGKMIKTDSHAVLMELFARDQDLVRQAAGKGGSQVQQAAAGQAVGQPPGPAPGPPGGGEGTNAATSRLMALGPSGGNLRWASGTASPNMGQKQHSVTFEGVPSLASWPHFSSVSSLSNLGGIQGVKSITNLSAADLSSQGNLNKMGNLAQVKSIENLGRGDSFAFLEVFFDDKSGMTSNNNSSNNINGQRGIKRERDDDDAIGLSLDGDEGASPNQYNKSSGSEQAPAQAPASESTSPIPADGKENPEEGDFDGGKLKRAYDDALAARGLIAVRRSCEKLTDLALPAKMQRTLSQEYIRQHNQGQPMGDFFSTNNSAYAPHRNTSSSQQYPAQQTTAAPVAEPGMSNTSVEVPSSTKCALCTSVNVDTQLRPCGHMFHGRCLKPSLQNARGPPKCPICQTSMQSAILAVPSAAGTDGTGAAGMTGSTEGAANASSATARGA